MSRAPSRLLIGQELDRHTPIMGVRVLRDGLPRQLFQGGPGHWQEATYRPISDFATAD